MENASKALIIAGAILLAIVLISLGMIILGQGEDIVKNNGMNQAQITALNSKFTKYEGEQKGSVIRTLRNEVKAANADANNKDAGVNITLTGADTVDATKTYTVTIKSFDDNGFISEIEVKRYWKLYYDNI